MAQTLDTEQNNFVFITTMHLIRQNAMIFQMMKSSTSPWKYPDPLLHLIENLFPKNHKISAKDQKFFVVLIFSKTNSLPQNYSTLCKFNVNFEMSTHKLTAKKSLWCRWPTSTWNTKTGCRTKKAMPHEIFKSFCGQKYEKILTKKKLLDILNPFVSSCTK